MIMLISAPLASASSPIAREELLGKPQRALLDDLQERAVGGREVRGGHDHRGSDRDQEVDDAGDGEATEEHLRVDPDRVLGLLGHVDRVLEADQRVEGQCGAGEGRGKDRRALLELERAADVRVALPQGHRRDEHDQHQSRQLDDREADVQLHRLGDAAEVHDRDGCEQGQRRDHHVNVDEDAQVVAPEATRERTCGGDPRDDHGEGDDEREERVLEGPIGEQPGAARVWVLRDQLRVGAGGEQRRDQRHHESGPDRTAGLGADLADQGVDAAAEDVADDEEEEELRA